MRNDGNRTTHVRGPRPAGRRRVAGFTLIELLVAVAILIFLAALVSAMAINYAVTANQRAAHSCEQAITNALALYKADTNILPMVRPDMTNVERNLQLTRALTDPAYGWPKAGRALLIDFLAKDSEGNEYLRDPWGNPYEYYSFKVEHSGIYTKREVTASYVTIACKIWGQCGDKVRYINNITYVAPMSEAILLEPYDNGSTNVIESGTDHGIPYNGPKSSLQGTWVVSRPRYAYLLERHDNLASGTTTSLTQVDIREWIETPTNEDHDPVSEDEMNSPDLQEIYYAYFFSKGPDGEFGAPIITWESSADPNSPEYARITPEAYTEFVTKLLPRPNMESYNNDNIGGRKPAYRYRGRLRAAP